MQGYFTPLFTNPLNSLPSNLSNHAPETAIFSVDLQ